MGDPELSNARLHAFRRVADPRYPFVRSRRPRIAALLVRGASRCSMPVGEWGEIAYTPQTSQTRRTSSRKVAVRAIWRSISSGHTMLAPSSMARMEPAGNSPLAARIRASGRRELEVISAASRSTGRESASPRADESSHEATADGGGAPSGSARPSLAPAKGLGATPVRYTSSAVI